MVTVMATRRWHGSLAAGVLALSLLTVEAARSAEVMTGQPSEEVSLSALGKSWRLPGLPGRETTVSKSCESGKLGSSPVSSCFAIREIDRAASCSDGPTIPTSSLWLAVTTGTITFGKRPGSVLIWTFRLDGRGYAASQRSPRRFGWSKGQAPVPKRIIVPLRPKELTQLLVTYPEKGFGHFTSLYHSFCTA
jgi:hypothetical protein